MVVPSPQELEPGLYVVSTPLGNARDITLRALDVLRVATVIASEDTRTTRKLLSIHAIRLSGRQLISYGEHNARRQRYRILQQLDRGASVALVAEAGTPLVADPGHRLLRQAIARGHSCFPVPGASAAIAALTVSGLASDRFMFVGFLPSKSGQRRTALADLASIPTTMIYFEAPHRISSTLQDMEAAFGSDRRAAVCREMTKRNETTLRGTLSHLAILFEETPAVGECSIVVEGASPVKSDSAGIENHLAAAMARLSLRDAVAEVAQAHQASRRKVYASAVALRRRRPSTAIKEDEIAD